MSNSVLQCKICGKIYQSLGADYCPNCADEMDACFHKVKDYLYDHPDTNVVDISEGTEVPEKIVLQFLKEGRLSLGDEVYGLECELCGASISAGRFCKKCHSVFESAFKGVASAQSSKQNEANTISEGPKIGKMHFNYKNK